MMVPMVCLGQKLDHTCHRFNSPVQKHDVSLSSDQEKSVSQFRELGHHEEEDPESADIIGPCCAHGWHESFLHDKESDLYDASQDTDVGKDGQRCVPGKQGPLQVHWLPRPHIVLTSINAGKVSNDRQVW